MNKKLGYYTVFNQIFDKKIQALLYATELYRKLGRNIDPKLLVSWNFNDEVFKDYDWTREPNASLKELYYQRARHLREKYDYIIISYSGGADSHNILQAFIEQGLHVDELYVIMMDKISGQFSQVDSSNTDVFYSHVSDNQFQAVPRLKELAPFLTRTKITYEDVTKLVFDVFEMNQDERWIMTMREELNPVDVARYNYSSFLQFRKNLDAHKSVGIVVGVDKPRIIIDSATKRVYTRFLDRIANIIPIGEYITHYTNSTIELFYWSPDACDLLCKQAHTVKAWLEKNRHYQIFYENNPDPTIYSITRTNIRDFNERALRTVLYDNWHPNWFQADKPRKDWFCEADHWFIKNAQGTAAHSIWLRGIKHIIDNTAPYISNRAQPDAFVNWYKDYYIGNLQATG
jgi:hypothetical protein